MPLRERLRNRFLFLIEKLGGSLEQGNNGSRPSSFIRKAWRSTTWPRSYIGVSWLAMEVSAKPSRRYKCTVGMKTVL